MAAGRWIMGAVALAALGAATIWALRDDPVPVDLALVRAGPMEVSVAAEGITRIREVYAVTAPIAGTVLRSPVAVGDPVVAGVTLLAEIRPAEPALLDARARAQAAAAVAEAEAAVRLAEVNLSRAESDLAFAEAQLARNRDLAARGTIAQRVLETSDQARTTARAVREAARSELALHRATLTRAEALLVAPGDGSAANGSCCVAIRAPTDGVVLSLEGASARPVQPGAPLMTLGDPTDLEIEVDLLSADAVRVTEGAAAHVTRWGGPEVLTARVRRIEPQAFTRVSALGIEEQRVRLHLTLLSPPEARPGLGDRYRVFVQVVVWSDDPVLQLPVSALFRHGQGWAVFRAEAGRAVLTPVVIGQRMEAQVQILEGLGAGDQVVAFPGSRIADGTLIEARVGQDGS